MSKFFLPSLIKKFILFRLSVMKPNTILNQNKVLINFDLKFTAKYVLR